jgi:hypothetical protein
MNGIQHAAFQSQSSQIGLIARHNNTSEDSLEQISWRFLHHRPPQFRRRCGCARIVTDVAGNVQKQIAVPGHHGDLCRHGDGSTSRSLWAKRERRGQLLDLRLQNGGLGLRDAPPGGRRGARSIRHTARSSH